MDSVNDSSNDEPGESERKDTRTQTERGIETPHFTHAQGTRKGKRQYTKVGRHSFPINTNTDTGNNANDHVQLEHHRGCSLLALCIFQCFIIFLPSPHSSYFSLFCISFCP